MACWKCRQFVDFYYHKFPSEAAWGRSPQGHYTRGRDWPREDLRKIEVRKNSKFCFVDFSRISFSLRKLRWTTAMFSGEGLTHWKTWGDSSHSNNYHNLPTECSQFKGQFSKTHPTSWCVPTNFHGRFPAIPLDFSFGEVITVKPTYGEWKKSCTTWELLGFLWVTLWIVGL